MGPPGMKFTVDDIVKGVCDIFSGEAERQHQANMMVFQEVTETLFSGREHLDTFLEFTPTWLKQKYIRLARINKNHEISEMIMFMDKNNDVTQIKCVNFPLSRPICSAIGMPHELPEFLLHIPKKRIPKFVDFFILHAKPDICQGCIFGEGDTAQCTFMIYGDLQRDFE